MKYQTEILASLFLVAIFGFSEAQERELKIREVFFSPASFEPSNLSRTSAAEYTVFPLIGFERPSDILAGDLFGFQFGVQILSANNAIFDGVADEVGTDFADLAGNELANPVIADECFEVLGKDPATGRFILSLTISVEATGTTEQWDSLIFDHRDPLDADGDGITGKGPDGIYGTFDDIIEPDGLVDTGDGVLDTTFPLNPPIQVPVVFDHDADCLDCKGGSLVSVGISIGEILPIPFDDKAFGPIVVTSATLSFQDRNGDHADTDGDGLSEEPFDVTDFVVFSDPKGWQGSFAGAFNMDDNFCTTQDFAKGNVAKIQLTVNFLSDGMPSENLICSFVLCGDANRDGVVNLLDVADFVQCIANDGMLEGEFVPECDVNLDGSIDLLDVSPFVAKLVSQ